MQLECMLGYDVQCTESPMDSSDYIMYLYLFVPPSSSTPYLETLKCK